MLTATVRDENCHYVPSCIYAVDAPLNTINVEINGETIPFYNQDPVIVDGRVLIPVRGVFEELDFNVAWDDDTETVILTSAGHEVIITIGSDAFITNGVSYAIDVPAQIIGGRTMLPIRAVLESAGHFVSWDAATSTAKIHNSSYVIDFGIEERVNSPAHIDGEMQLPSEQDIAEFIIMNYPQMFIPQNMRRTLYNLYPDVLVATAPYGVSGLVANNFEIYDFEGDGNLVLIINLGIPETGHLGHAAFKFIEGEFRVVDTFDFWSYMFFRNSSNAVIVAENHLDNFHKFYYLDTIGSRFEKTMFAHIEGMRDVFNGITFNTHEETLRAFDELFNDLELITSLPTDSIRDLILSNPEIVRWVDFSYMDIQ